LLSNETKGVVLRFADGYFFVIQARTNFGGTEAFVVGPINRRTLDSTPTLQGCRVGIRPIAFGSTLVFLAPLKPKVAEGVFLRRFRGGLEINPSSHLKKMA
jgi:hypothetical protein